MNIKKIAATFMTVSIYLVLSLVCFTLLFLWFPDFIVWLSAKYELLPAPLVNNLGIASVLSVLPLGVLVLFLTIGVFLVYRAIAELQPVKYSSLGLTAKERRNVVLLITCFSVIVVAVYFMVNI